jgi:outer membrane protein W
MSTRAFLRASAVAVALMASAYNAASAQMAIEAEAGPFVGGTMFLSSSPGQLAIGRQGASPVIVQDGQFRNAITVGVHAGVRFAERFSLEGTYAWVPTRMTARHGLEAHGGGVDVNAIRYGLTSAYHFAPRGRFQPYVGLGVTGETLSYGPHLAWERRSSLAGTAMLGGNLWVADGLMLRLNAGRDLITRSGDHPRNQLAVTVGLSARQRLR